jgi:translation initiation factor 5B
VDNYLSWLKSQREAKFELDFGRLVKPAKMRILEGYVFRRAKPAIVGVEILAGEIKPKLSLVRAEDGADVGVIEQIQEKGEALSEAEMGMQVAISIDKPVVGRHVFEKDVLYVKVPEADAKALLSAFMDKLSVEEQEALNEYAGIMRKKIPFWAA